MRYELSEYEWTAIKPMLPNKPRLEPSPFEFEFNVLNRNLMAPPRAASIL
jgi:hypothetical protein